MKNLKKTALILIFIFSSAVFYAQAFGDGKNILSVGFGLPSTPKIQDEYNQYSDKSAYVYHNFGTVVLKYERCASKKSRVPGHIESWHHTPAPLDS